MLDIDQEHDDNFDVEHKRTNINMSNYLQEAIHDENIKGMDFINVIRLAIGHRTFLQNGTSGDKKKIEEVEEEKEVSEEDEVSEIVAEFEDNC